MPADVVIRCSCGALRGVLGEASAARGNRAVCYCDDCQLFAHFLQHPAQILDAHGGTDIFQTSPGRLRFEQGKDELCCMRLRPDGLVRWYAGCCRTPIGNTLARRGAPFVGLIHSCMELSPTARDAVLGPVRGRIFQRFAVGDRASLPPSERPLAAQLGRFALLVLAARMRGDHLRSPFFDEHSGALAALPRVLDPPELAALQEARTAA